MRSDTPLIEGYHGKLYDHGYEIYQVLTRTFQEHLFQTLNATCGEMKSFIHG